MEAAVRAVKEDQMSCRKGSRLYNVSYETLRRRVVGEVEVFCKPGPQPIFTPKEEELIAQYLVTMSDMGFGLSREDVMALAYSVAKKIGRDNPFHDGHAGRGWLDGFRSRHPKLTLRAPQPLSYCRALSGNQATINDFFEKLGGIYARLNLLSRPMQVYNADESGVDIVHKPGEVFAQLGRQLCL